MTQTNYDEAVQAFLNSETTCEKQFGLKFRKLRESVITKSKSGDPLNLLKFELVYSQFLWSDEEWVPNIFKLKMKGCEIVSFHQTEFRLFYFGQSINKVFATGIKRGKVDLTIEEIREAIFDAVEIVRRENIPHISSEVINRELGDFAKVMYE